MLRMTGITKRYGEQIANDGVNLSVAAGEIHALLGENGAGKSTLVKVLYGAVQPDAGDVEWRGQPVRILGPAQAKSLGIGMVFQHFSLFDSMTVAENVALAVPGGKPTDALSREVSSLGARYGLSLAADKLVADLSAGERQRVEIVRCLIQTPSLLALDEPTSVLTPREAEALFKALRALAAEGTAILYISHKLEEVRQLCDHATILRRGRVVASVTPRDVSTSDLAAAMVGAAPDAPPIRRASAFVPPPASPNPDAAPPLRLDGLSLPPETPLGAPLRDIGFTLKPGRIYAVAGVAGAGQAELFAALSGERRADRADAVRLFGVPAGRLNVAARRRLGAAFVSERRLGHGASPGAPLSENLLITRAQPEDGLVGRFGLLKRAATRAMKDRIRNRFDVRAAAPDPAAATLSGGNLQKFLVGREIDRAPRLMVVDQPTWGVDVGAAIRIRHELMARADAGATVLAITQDLDEAFAVSDEIAVLCEGRLSPFRPTETTSRAEVGRLMGGVAAEAPQDQPKGAVVDAV